MNCSPLTLLSALQLAPRLDPRQAPQLALMLAPLLTLCLSFPTLAQSFEESTPQPSGQLRMLQPPELEADLDLEAADLFSINRMTVNGRGLLAFLDYQDEQIVVMDGTTFRDIRRIGGGMGSGPMEFSNSFDVRFDDPSTLLVADVGNAWISRWSTDGSFRGVIPLEKMIPSRLAPCEDGGVYVLLQNYTRQGMFARINEHGQALRTFQTISRFGSQSVFHRDGSMLCLDGALYYAGYFFDFLKRYSAEGELVYSRSIKGFTPNTTLVERGSDDMGSYITRSKEARRSVGEILTWNGLLYIGFSGEKDQLLRRIDIYDPETGDYRASIPLPVPFEEFALDATGLYILTPATLEEPPKLLRYRLQEGAIPAGPTPPSIRARTP